MTAGQFVYNIYYRPVGYVRQTLRTGIGKTLAVKKGQKAMMEAVGGLEEIVYPGEVTYTVYFLTGKKYWHQTAFCLYSLQKHSGCNIHAVLVDDGSFDAPLIRQIEVQFPTTSQVVLVKEVEETLDKRLPQSLFPVLRALRLHYKHLRKLTDVHCLAGDGPKLVLDSDMLFFKQPAEILRWLKHPKGMIFMRDVEEAYGYTQDLLKELSGSNTIPKQLNVGVAGIDSKVLDWQKIEDWTKTMLNREGGSYLQEQALTALVASGQAISFLDQQNYKVLPRITGPSIPEVLHHYVADSKFDYFVKGWRAVLAGS